MLSLLTGKRMETFAHLVVFAVRVFRDVLGFFELCFQERDALVVRKTATLKCFAVPKSIRIFFIFFLQSSFHATCTTRRHSIQIFRTNTDDWYPHLANVNEARTKHPQNRRRLVTSPSECRWIAVLVYKVLICKMNLPCDLELWPLNPKTVPRSFPTPSLNTFGSFVFSQRDYVTFG